MQDKQVALVTGANRGIGFELFKQLASMGFKVILTSRDPKGGSKAAQKLAESGLDVSFIVIDVTQKEWGLSSEDIAQAVAYVIDTPERVSVSDMIIRPTKQEV